MVIGGLQKFSTLDYTGYLSAIVFTQGCNFKCHFCYNPMLVWPLEDSKIRYKKSHSLVREDDFFAFLQTRKNKLDAVVITGGEPTMHHDLPEFIKKIKDLGFKIKLDTNGTNPEMLKKLLVQDLIDYFAMDFKAPLGKYQQVVGVAVDFSKILESVKIIMSSNISYEFRTTVVPGLISKDDIVPMAEIIKGADKWFLQSFHSVHDLVDQSLKGARSYTEAELEKMAELANGFVKECKVR
ncbi:MAG: anaerobic ribonucleoside-triphosphate reductase activating protein [bacterium]